MECYGIAGLAQHNFNAAPVQHIAALVQQNVAPV